MLIQTLSRLQEHRQADGLTRLRQTCQSPSGPVQHFLDTHGHQCQLLNFSSNNYLGMAAHPAVIEAWARGAEQWGVGSGASHLVSGHCEAHDALESELHDWLGSLVADSAVLSFGSGYLANLAILTALGSLPEAILLTDKLNHASLIDGALLARADVQRYPHARMDLLEMMLKKHAGRLKFIVTDGVFSMDGDVAPIDHLLALAEAHDAWIIVDDAHGVGILGPSGQGCLSGYRSERLILMGTLGKAMGVYGAFVLAHRQVTSWLLQVARPYIYTTALPGALAHAAAVSVRLTRGHEGNARRAILQGHIARWNAELKRIGMPWHLLPSNTAIQAIVVGDNAETCALGQALDKAGIKVGVIRPPTVAVGTGRLRVCLSAGHSCEQVDFLIDTLNQLTRHGKVLGNRLVRSAV